MKAPIIIIKKKNTNVERWGKYTYFIYIDENKICGKYEDFINSNVEIPKKMLIEAFYEVKEKMILSLSDAVAYFTYELICCSREKRNENGIFILNDIETIKETLKGICKK